MLQQKVRAIFTKLSNKQPGETPEYKTDRAGSRNKIYVYGKYNNKRN